VSVRDATPEDLARWDVATVAGPGGSVWQSRAWAEHAARTGWRTRQLVDEAGIPVLALVRPWPLVGGSSAYIPRGPVSAGDPAPRVVERLTGVVERLVADGVDVVATDAEIPAPTGYPALLRAAGFTPIEELMPSRHRMAVALDGDAEAAWERIARKTRQRIGSARRRGLVVRRFDALPGATEAPEDPAGGPGGTERPPGALVERAAEAAFGPFHALLEATGTRRGFAIGSRAGSVAWWLSALRAGHLVYLEVRDAAPADDWLDPQGTLLGGAIFFRQGGRLTYGHSGDRADLRGAHPGVVHVILWDALRLAIAEGALELDLGGVDVVGARALPAEGDAMWGLYEFKRAFGGAWVDLTGAHERVARPRRYAAGRALAAAARRLPGVGRG
jgi:lipid II:glycine glycyltransferase (peptidoglycan interpeptide bridge formation enzyme)